MWRDTPICSKCDWTKVGRLELRNINQLYSSITTFQLPLHWCTTFSQYAWQGGIDNKSKQLIAPTGYYCLHYWSLLPAWVINFLKVSCQTAFLFPHCVCGCLVSSTSYVGSVPIEQCSPSIFNSLKEVTVVYDESKGIATRSRDMLIYDVLNALRQKRGAEISPLRELTQQQLAPGHVPMMRLQPDPVSWRQNLSFRGLTTLPITL